MTGQDCQYRLISPKSVPLLLYHSTVHSLKGENVIDIVFNYGVTFCSGMIFSMSSKEVEFSFSWFYNFSWLNNNPAMKDSERNPRVFSRKHDIAKVYNEKIARPTMPGCSQAAAGLPRLGASISVWMNAEFCHISWQRKCISDSKFAIYNQALWSSQTRGLHTRIIEMRLPDGNVNKVAMCDILLIAARGRSDTERHLPVRCLGALKHAAFVFR